MVIQAALCTCQHIQAIIRYSWFHMADQAFGSNQHLTMFFKSITRTCQHISRVPIALVLASCRGSWNDDTSREWVPLLVMEWITESLGFSCQYCTAERQCWTKQRFMEADVCDLRNDHSNHAYAHEPFCQPAQRFMIAPVVEKEGVFKVNVWPNHPKPTMEGKIR